MLSDVLTCLLGSVSPDGWLWARITAARYGVAPVSQLHVDGLQYG